MSTKKFVTKAPNAPWPFPRLTRALFLFDTYCNILYSNKGIPLLFGMIRTYWNRLWAFPMQGLGATDWANHLFRNGNPRQVGRPLFSLQSR